LYAGLRVDDAIQASGGVPFQIQRNESKSQSPETGYNLLANVFVHETRNGFGFDFDTGRIFLMPDSYLP
jgi:hypothetical protein